MIWSVNIDTYIIQLIFISSEMGNQYPVLFISLKDEEGRNFELAYDKLKSIIARLYIKYSFLEKTFS